jgi:cysteine-rich repeat protein
MHSRWTVVASWLVASSVVACGGLVLEPPTSGGDDGMQSVDGGHDPTGATRNDGGIDERDAGVAHDGGIVHGDAGLEASTTPCGDGVLTTGEACDDGNKSSADGCNASCKIEPGWSCADTPSICETTCGDGIVAGSETCDDDSTCPGSCRRTLWSKRYGGSQYRQASALAVDTAGAAVITGNFRGSVDFGGGPLVSSGTNDVFIAKIDGAGKHLWSRRAGGTGDDRAWAVATDAAGNVVVTGVFSDTINFGGGPLVSAGSWDVFVVKLDAAGNHLWSKRFGNSEQQEAHAVAVDSAGNVVLGGMFWGAIDFGGGALTTAGGIDMFVAKLDATGHHVWSKRFGNTNNVQNARAVAVDASGGVLVTGGSAGSIDLGGGTLAAIGESDAFLLSLDAGGAHQWSKRWGRGNAYVSGTSMTVDTSGNVIMAGYESGPTDLGTGALPYKGMLDVIVGKFSPAGAPIFAHSFGSTSNDAALSVATDGSGNVLLTGYSEGAMAFGNNPIAHVPGRNTFIAKLDPSGALLWGAGYGNSATGTGIATDAMGNLFAAGYFTGSLELGGVPLTSVTLGDDVYLAKLSP